MASAMANEARRGKLLVLEGARHLMNLTHADAVNAALRELLQTPVEAFDFKDLRKAFGSFMTGVTVVTTQEANGSLRGFTANSFSSVSLDPPLLLVCMNKASASCEAFSSAASFAVNILSEVTERSFGCICLETLRQICRRRLHLERFRQSPAHRLTRLV